MSDSIRVRFSVFPESQEWRAHKLSQYVVEHFAFIGEQPEWLCKSDLIHRIEWADDDLPQEVDRLADNEIAWVTAEVCHEMASNYWDPDEVDFWLDDMRLECIDTLSPLERRNPQ